MVKLLRKPEEAFIAHGRSVAQVTALELLTAFRPPAPVELYAELTAGELAGYGEKASEGASDV
jgi:hypothetical protein